MPQVWGGGERYFQVFTVYTCLYLFTFQSINILHPVISSQSFYLIKKGCFQNQQRYLRD